MEPGSLPTGAVAPIAVHSSIRGLAGVVTGPLLLAALGVVAMQYGEPGRPVPRVIVALAVVAGVAVLRSYPHRTTFVAEGVVRHCLLRRQLLAWGTLTSIDRTPPPASRKLRGLRRVGEGATLRGDGSVGPRRPGAEPVGPRSATVGGLMARSGRRRYLLSDQTESQDQHDRISSLMRTLPIDTELRAARPDASTPPTDLYRPRRFT